MIGEMKYRADAALFAFIMMLLVLAAKECHGQSAGIKTSGGGSGENIYNSDGNIESPRIAQVLRSNVFNLGYSDSSGSNAMLIKYENGIKLYHYDSANSVTASTMFMDGLVRSNYSDPLTLVATLYSVQRVDSVYHLLTGNGYAIHRFTDYQGAIEDRVFDPVENAGGYLNLTGNLSRIYWFDGDNSRLSYWRASSNSAIGSCFDGAGNTSQIALGPTTATLTSASVILNDNGGTGQGTYGYPWISTGPSSTGGKWIAPDSIVTSGIRLSTSYADGVATINVNDAIDTMQIPTISGSIDTTYFHHQGGNSYGASWVAGSIDNNTVNFKVQDTIYQTIGTDGNITLTNTVANNTTNTVDILNTTVATHGTPGVGFGPAWMARGETSTLQAQDMGELAFRWTNATEGSEEAKLSLSLGDAGGAIAECLKMDRTNSGGTGQLSIGTASAATYRNNGITTATTFSIGNSGSDLNIGASSGYIGIYNTSTAASAIDIQTLDNAATSTATISIGGGTNLTQTSGTKNYVTHKQSFLPTSGSAAHTSLAFTGTFNQTGGASGITRGIYMNETLTAVADWRGLEQRFSEADAKGIYQVGTAVNKLGFKTAIGDTSTTPTAYLHLAAGTTTVAPLKQTVGSLLTSNESGVTNYDTTFYDSYTGLGRVSRRGGVTDQYTDVGNNNGFETQLFALSEGAYPLYMRNGDKGFFKASGTHTDSSRTAVFVLKFSGTEIFNSGTLTWTNNGYWEIEATMIRTGSAGAKILTKFTTDGIVTQTYLNQSDISITDYSTLLGSGFTLFVTCQNPSDDNIVICKQAIAEFEGKSNNN